MLVTNDAFNAHRSDYLCRMKKFYANHYNRIVVASWAFFIFLLWMQYMHLSTFSEATLMLLVLLPVISISIVLTNRWLPRALHRKALKTFILQFIGTTLLMAAILAVGYQLLRWAENSGYFPHSLLLADKNSLGEDFLYAIPSILVINFGFSGLRFLYEHMTLQKAHLEAQLQVLQAQINPHFMFNILNHIHILMRTDVEMASSLLLEYADILRYQLYSGRSELVKLEQDIQFLKNFVEIEKVRWGDKLQVSCTWEMEDNEQQIPPLLFITFVENAFKHVSRSSSERNYIQIAFVQKENLLCLDVENSKSTIPLKRNGSGLGLENIQHRLDLLYHNNYRLTIEDKDAVYHSKLEIWQKL